MKPISMLFTIVITSSIVGGGVYFYQYKQAKNTENSLNSQITLLQLDVDNLKAANAKAPTPTSTTPEPTINTQVAPTTPSQTIPTDENNVRNLVKDFESTLEARDTGKALAFFTDPISDQEKSDLNFLKGTDIDSPRLFSTKGSGALFAYTDHTIKTISKDTADEYTIKLTQKIQNYDDKSIKDEAYTLIAMRISGIWKVDKFYRDGIAETYQKYNDQFGG